MRSAALPRSERSPNPQGESVEVLAAPINPIDLAVSRGILATGHPELPYVPGCEAVGRTDDGRVVWIFGGSLGRTSSGAIAERAPDRGRACDRRARGRGSRARRGARDRRPRRLAAVRVARAARGRRDGARARRDRLGRPRRRADGEAARRGPGRSGRSKCRGARACGESRCRCDDPPRRARRPRGGFQGGVRRRGPELRLRHAVG